ncbi:hypothetical protein Hanom_Chr14g01247431 [Helianthus anomalus]
MHFRLKRTGSDAFLLKKKQLEWLAELKPGGFFVLKENLARSGKFSLCHLCLCYLLNVYSLVHSCP